MLLLNLPGSEIDGWHHHVQSVTVLFMPPGLLVLEYSGAVDRGPVCVLFMSLLFLIRLKRAFLLYRKTNALMLTKKDDSIKKTKVTSDVLFQI